MFDDVAACGYRARRCARSLRRLGALSIRASINARAETGLRWLALRDGA
jgi:hypothetical protein